jgi:hypothetical protein
MIQPLRQCHRAAFAALAVLLPVAFIAGIAARKGAPVVASFPGVLNGSLDASARVLRKESDLWPGRRIRTTLGVAASGLIVEFISGELVGPDVLVYWETGEVQGTEGLSEKAQLLGGFSTGAPTPLPVHEGETGRFTLYSLANHEIVARSKMLTISAAAVERQ